MRLFQHILSILIVSTWAAFSVGESIPKGEKQNGQIIVPQDSNKPVEVGELLCVELPSGETECGKVVSAGSDVVRIEVDTGEASAPAQPVEIPPVKKKKKAKREKPVPSPVSSPIPSPEASSPAPEETIPPPPPLPPPPKEPKSAECNPTLERLGVWKDHPLPEPLGRKDWNATSGLMLGTSFYNAYIGVSRRSDDLLDIGLDLAGALGSVEGQSVRVLGVGVYANYWIEKNRLGWVITPGVALNFIRKTIPGTTASYYLNTFNSRISVGWRQSVGDAIFLTPRFGVLQASPFGGDRGEIEFTGFFPFIAGEISIPF